MPLRDVDIQIAQFALVCHFPQRIAHNSNGRFVAICGDGEYIIYTSQALRNKAFGSALDFVWSNDGNVDPVGACVGARGARVRMVVNELRGEKIDIVPFSEDPADFVMKGLSPAKAAAADVPTGKANLIRESYQAGMKPVAIARSLRISRSLVDQVLGGLEKPRR